MHAKFFTGDGIMAATYSRSARPSARGADPAPGTGRSTGPQGPRLLQGVGWESGITPTSNSPTAAGAFLGSPCESGEGRRVPGGWRRPRAEGGPRVAGRGGGARRPRLLRSAAGRWARARRAGVRPGRAPPPELGRAIPMMPSHRARLPERGRRLPPPPPELVIHAKNGPACEVSPSPGS